MGNVSKRLSCEDANKMDMVDYLSTIGIEPVNTIRQNEYWYESPFRDEHTPSFKVDRNLNRWYDHGEGRGGKLVDFAIAYHKCSVGEFLRKLSGNEHLPVPEKRMEKIPDDNGNRIVIIDSKPLSNPALIQYGLGRGIEPDILKKFCNEISYSNGGKYYYGIGFKNDLGGYELRSKYFKGSSSPKGFTHLINGNKELAVFEGFFNFLSFQQLHKNAGFPPTDFLILNSLSFFEKARPIMESYQRTNLYLDTNAAGQKFTAKAIALDKIYQDKSSLYTDHEDLNDFLLQKPKETAIQHKPKRRLKL